MSPEKYYIWLRNFEEQEERECMESLDHWLDEGFYQKSISLRRYEKHAPARYVEYAHLTGIEKDYTDKPLEREDRINAKKEKK